MSSSKCKIKEWKSIYSEDDKTNAISIIRRK
jgi:hypothetical protein